MTNNPLQPDFSKKVLIEDKGNRPIPQYYDIVKGEFHPNTAGQSMPTVFGIDDNPYQPTFSSKTLLVDKKGRVIPQYYNVDDGFFYPLTVDNSGGGSGPGPLPAGLVRSVNLILPDAQGNVELPPVPNQYRYVDPIPPTEPESVYEDGTTAFITYFERATMPSWADIFDNPDIPDGDMMVVTHKYHNGDHHCIQMVDTFRDGVFTAQFSRVWDYKLGKWTSLQQISVVQSVNGVKPGVDGNVDVETYRPVGEFIEEEALFDHTMRTTGEYIVAAATGVELPSKEQYYVRVTMIDVGTPGYYGKVYQAIELTAGTGLYNYYIRMDTLVNEEPYVYPDTWKKVGGGSNVIVIDDLNTPSSTNALSAGMGKMVNDNLNAHKQSKATDVQIGHVQVDGATIKVDQNGIISAAGSNYFINNDILPNTHPTTFKVGTTQSTIHSAVGDTPYSAWVNFINTQSGNTITNANPFTIFIETVKSNRGDTAQTIKVIGNSINQYYMLMVLTRRSFTNDNFNAPGVEMTTLRGNGNPEGVKYAFGGNSYYDYTNNLMYYKTGDGTTNTSNIGWKLYEESKKVASITELGHVKIDGDTITIDNGVISANTTGDFRIDNAILYSKLPNEYLQGRTISILTNDNPNFRDWMYFGVTQILGTWEFEPGECRLEIITDKTNNQVTQNIEVYLNQFKTGSSSSDKFYKMFTVSRIATNDLTAFRTAKSVANLVVKGITDSDPILGVRGSLYFDMYNGQLMGKKRTAPNGLNDEGWMPITDHSASFFAGATLPTTATGNYAQVTEGCHFLNTTTMELYRCRNVINDPAWDKVASFPKIVNNSYTPVPDDMESVYSAYTTNEMVNNLKTTLSNELHTHISQKASATDEGHVKVDNTTIIANDGVISTKHSAYMDDTIAYGTKPSEIKKGITFTQLRKGNSIIDSWLATINGLFGWKIDSSQFCLNIRTIRDDVSTTQEVDIILILNSDGYKGDHMAKMTRTSLTDSTWNNPRGIMNIGIGSGSPQPAQYGLIGSLWIDRVEGSMFQMRNPDATVPKDTGWIAMTNAIKPLSYIPVDSSDQSLYSAHTINSKLSSHADIKASETDVGHVKVDGTTITANNGVISATQVPGPKGDPGVVVPGDSRQVKMWFGTAITSGGDGSWVIDYTAAGFTEVKTIQTTLESAITAAADKPVSTYVVSKNLNSASGKAYKATSAGLLTAMQQLPAENGVTVHVLVVGY